MYKLFVIFALQFALIDSEIGLLHNQNKDGLQENDGVLKVTDFGPLSFTLEWAPFGTGESDYVVEGKRDAGDEITFDQPTQCKDGICTFTSGTVTSVSPCERITVNVSRGEESHYISFNMAPTEPTIKKVNGNNEYPQILIVTWDKLNSDECINEVTGYSIKCGSDGIYEVDIIDSPYELTCPKACTPYTVYVAAQWSNGTGNSSHKTGTTGSKAPGKPAPTIENLEQTKMTVEWKTPDTTDSCELSGYTISWTPTGGEVVTDEVNADATSYPIDGLKCNTEYTITVTAKTGASKPSSVSDDITQTTTDKTPDPITVKTLLPGDANTELVVTWSDLANYDCTGVPGLYKITWTAEGAGSPTGTADASESPYTIEGLTHCTTYTVSVQARSATDTLGPLGNSLAETTTADPPNQPTDVAGNADTSSITLSWTLSDTSKTCPLSGHTVTWTPADGDGSGGLHELGGDATSDIITDLICNNDYTVNVTATATDNKTNSATKDFTTMDKAPGQAKEVKVVADSSSQFTASWKAPDYACTGSTLGPYKVKWTPGGDTSAIDVDKTSLTINNLIPCTEYTVNVAGSSQTNIIGKYVSTATTLLNDIPGKSIDVRIGDITPHSLEVEWNAPSKVPPNGNNCPITKYTVQCISGDMVEEHNITDPEPLTYTFTGLEACAEYNITVITYTETGGNATDPITYETETNAPPIEAVSITPESKSANVTWARPNDTKCELEYGVEYNGKTLWTNNKTDDSGGLDKPINNQDPTVTVDLDKLLAYTHYTICVTVLTGNTTCNTTTTQKLAPSPPKDVAFVEGSITDESVMLKWQYPEEENGILQEYVVYWHMEGDSSSNQSVTVEDNVTNHTINGLEEGNYIFTVIAVNDEGPSIQSASINQEMNGPTVCGGGCIAGIVIGILLLMALAISGFIFRDRITKKFNKGPPPVEESPYELRGAAILKSDFRRHVEELELDRAEGAYQMLNDESQQKSKFAAAKPFNKAKNRFGNIHPFDETRVKLQLIRNGPKGSDYINANHITFPDTFKLEFIATQGPLDSTINDFYRMIWECNIYDAVMLCNIFEKGKSKCAQYWTESGERSIEFGEFKISCQAEEEDRSKTFVTRYIDVSKDGQHRMLKQHHFTAWPDFGVPKSEEDLLRFLAFTKQNYNSHGKSVLTHCSAGVGRTGTFIALWVLTSLLEQNKSAKSIDVHKISLMMREGRSDMIQTKDQYLYLHKCLLKYMEDTGNSFPTTNKDADEPIYGNVNEAYRT